MNEGQRRRTARPRRNPVTVSLLARLFQAAGVVLALPSAAVLALYAWHVAQRAAATPPRAAGPASDGLVGLFEGALQVADGVASVVGVLADVVLAMAAFAAAIGLALALCCWCTGRGLRRAARWARVSGALLLAGAGVVLLLMALSADGLQRLVPAVPALLCGLGVQALWAGAPRPLRSSA